MMSSRPTFCNFPYVDSAYYEGDPYLLALSLVLPIRVKKEFSPLFSQRFFYVLFATLIIETEGNWIRATGSVMFWVHLSNYMLLVLHVPDLAA